MINAFDILIENATSLKEKREIRALTESESTKMTNTMVAKLYQACLDKDYSDFGTIPSSKGDITKFSGYKSMVSTIDLVASIADASNTKIKEVDTLRTSISNIIALRDDFTKGFMLDNEFIIMQYNVMVACLVESTTVLMMSYVDYVKSVAKVDFTIMNESKSIGGTCMSTLKTFNTTCKTGIYGKMLKNVMKNTNSKTMEESVALSATAWVIIAVVAAFAPFVIISATRQAIYYFIESRANFSDFLKLQATFLEMNKNNLMANTNIPAVKKNEIIKKQSNLAKKLREKADRIMVKSKLAEDKVSKDIKSEDSKLTFSNVKSATADGELGYTLL